MRGQPDTIVPDELADAPALGRMTDWTALPVFHSGRYRQQSSEDRGKGGPPAQVLWERGNRDMNNFICASDDAQPARGTDPFVLDIERCAEPYVRGFVMARFLGSGRLARIWMTAASIRRQPADHEVVRLYVDDKRAPVVQVPLSKLLDGSAGEMFGTPFGAGSSRHLAWYYPVVFGTKLIVTIDRLSPKDLYYHQTSVVLDAEQVQRSAPAGRLRARDEASKLLRADAPLAGTPHARRLTLAPGERTTAHELTGPATIVNARLRVAQARVADLADVQLRVGWDHDETPAIALAMADLFSVQDALPGESSLALGAELSGDDVELSLRLPMPFETAAVWELSNRGRAPIELELVLEVTDSTPSSRWGHLHVQRFETSAAHRSAHPLVAATGQGRLVGVCMTMRGHGVKRRGMPGHRMHFLEGDETGFVDGERTIVGTGTEDYFNGAFYFEEGPSASPFAQVWGIVPDAPDGRGQARVSACRWHVLGDAIDFSRSLALEMEIGPGEPAVLDRYRSVAFLYQ